MYVYFTRQSNVRYANTGSIHHYTNTRPRHATLDVFRYRKQVAITAGIALLGPCRYCTWKRAECYRASLQSLRCWITSTPFQQPDNSFHCLHVSERPTMSSTGLLTPKLLLFSIQRPFCNDTLLSRFSKKKTVYKLDSCLTVYHQCR